MISDKTVAYIAAVHPAFEDLKQATAQLAGLLVLRQRDPQLRRSAEEAYARAMDTLNVRVPTEAKPHHAHLLKAAAQLNSALHTQHDPLPFLKAADADLRAASRILPGFPMVDFQNACCHHTHV
jgi:hypothetical protein